MTIKTEIFNGGRIQQTVIDDFAQSRSIRIANTMEAGFRDALEKLGWLPPEKVAKTVRQAGEVMRERCAKAADDGCSEESYLAVEEIRALPVITLDDLPAEAYP